jgi:esterase/lipase superfamily enzyme
MAERFASLLRYVGSRRAVVDGKSAPFFDRIIIVSHSQGTVIAADLLRFLRVTGAELGLVDGRFRLVTMGSPLHQLYAQRGSSTQ